MEHNSSSKRRWPRGLNRQVFLLGLVSMFADVASEMLTPVIPIFLTTVLGASVTNVGLIEGFAEATASLLKTVAGKWSDKWGKRVPFVVVGYLLSALAKPLVGLSQIWPQVLAARAMDRFGKGIRNAPRDALLAGSIASEERARAFGWHRAMDTMGAVIGPLLALLFISRFPDRMRLIFVLALVPGLFSVLAAMLVKEAPVPATVLKVEPTLTERAPLTGGFKNYLAVWTLFCLVNSSDAFLILRVRDLGFDFTATILLYCFYNLIYASASPSLGGLAERFGEKRILAIGLLLFAIVYLGFAFSGSSVVSVAMLFALYGIYAAATDGVGKSMAVALLPKAHRGYGLGLLGAVTGLSALVASVVAGSLWDHAGAPWAFAYGAGGALLAAIGLWLLPMKNDEPVD